MQLSPAALATTPPHGTPKATPSTVATNASRRKLNPNSKPFTPQPLQSDLSTKVFKDVKQVSAESQCIHSAVAVYRPDGTYGPPLEPDQNFCGGWGKEECCTEGFESPFDSFRLSGEELMNNCTSRIISCSDDIPQYIPLSIRHDVKEVGRHKRLLKTKFCRYGVACEFARKGQCFYVHGPQELKTRPPKPVDYPVRDRSTDLMMDIPLTQEHFSSVFRAGESLFEQSGQKNKKPSAVVTKQDKQVLSTGASVTTTSANVTVPSATPAPANASAPAENEPQLLKSEVLESSLAAVTATAVAQDLLSPRVSRDDETGKHVSSEESDVALATPPAGQPLHESSPLEQRRMFKAFASAHDFTVPATLPYLTSNEDVKSPTLHSGSLCGLQSPATLAQAIDLATRIRAFATTTERMQLLLQAMTILGLTSQGEKSLIGPIYDGQFAMATAAAAAAMACNGGNKPLDSENDLYVKSEDAAMNFANLPLPPGLRIPRSASR